ncbi:hypothetical protein Tcan_17859 [Toxocara canis]|uniref:Uncharacterized protein n=1 Tax=Toxocara canis TaxID=6265 RepID=A0A0B2VIF0_TOXCA|nr:hypothetical protein Tcan_17859 [Toxocara canis]
MDTFAFQEYFESLSAPVDCCIACYSSADNETVESLLNRWLPLFYEYFPHRPAIVCELIDCNAHENSVWPPNWKEIFANVVCQMEISVFEKAGLRSLFDEAICSCDAFIGKRRNNNNNNKRNCAVM